VESIPTMLAWMIQKNPDRELYFSYNKITDNSMPAGTQLVPYGISHKGFLPGQIAVIDDARAEHCWNVLRMRHLQDPGFPMDERSLSFIYKDYGVNRNSLGIFYEDRGDEIRAKLTPKSGASELLKEEDEYQRSYHQYLWAQEWDGTDAMYPYNVGNALYHLGRKYESTQWYERATSMNPHYPEAYFNWAVAEMELGQYQKSGELFQKVIDLKPDYPDAKRGLDYLKTQGVFHPAS
jgi:tetratricopeptide (TPR) repeat protein